jgi:hypothetical protein
VAVVEKGKVLRSGENLQQGQTEEKKEGIVDDANQPNSQRGGKGKRGKGKNNNQGKKQQKDTPNDDSRKKESDQKGDKQKSNQKNNKHNKSSGNQENEKKNKESSPPLPPTIPPSQPQQTSDIYYILLAWLQIRCSNQCCAPFMARSAPKTLVAGTEEAVGVGEMDLEGTGAEEGGEDGRKGSRWASKTKGLVIQVNPKMRVFSNERVSWQANI